MKPTIFSSIIAEDLFSIIGQKSSPQRNSGLQVQQQNSSVSCVNMT